MPNAAQYHGAGKPGGAAAGGAHSCCRARRRRRPLRTVRAPDLQHSEVNSSALQRAEVLFAALTADAERAKDAERSAPVSATSLCVEDSKGPPGG